MKPQTYLRALLGTFTATTYYRSILKAPLTFSLRFFIVSIFLLSLFRIGLFWRRELPAFHQQVVFASTELEKNYPADLKISWNGQKLESNAALPIPIYYPSNWDHQDLPKMLGYIDTNANSLEAVQQKTQTSALFFVTAENLYLAQASSGYSQLPLSEFSSLLSPLTITQTELHQHWSEWVEHIWQAGLPVVTFGSILYPGYLVASVFLSATLLSWFGWYLAKAFGQKSRWKKVWQVSLHIAVVAQTVALIQTALWPQLHLPLFSLTFWLYFILVMIELIRASKSVSSL